MTRSRTRQGLTVLLGLALAVAALAGPAITLAKPSAATATSTPVMPAVSPGAAIAYDVFFSNDSSSNISQLYLNASTPAGGTLVTIESISRPGTCSTANNTLSCSFGSLAQSDAPITLRVVYATPSNASKFDVHFLFTTTGVAPDKGKNSHGDAYDAFTSVALDSSLDFAGGYVMHAGNEVADSTNLSRRNPQYTKVSAPAANIPVSVGEANTTAACPGVAASSCFGQLSTVNVAGGTTFPGGFTIEIGYSANKPNVNFVHFFDNGTFEFITNTCNSTTAPTNMPCKIVDTSHGDTFATLWVTSNGNYRGY